jgi:hypothetical protein
VARIGRYPQLATVTASLDFPGIVDSDVSCSEAAIHIRIMVRFSARFIGQIFVNCSLLTSRYVLRNRKLLDMLSTNAAKNLPGSQAS